MLRRNKSFNSYLIFHAIIFSIGLMKSQNLKVFKSRIDSCFVDFNNRKSTNSDKTCGNIKHIPFYESFEYKEFATDQKLKNGANCKELLYSCNLSSLIKINAILNRDENALYSLLDSSGNKIFDLQKQNCGGKDQIKVSKINQIEMTNLINSYEKWYKLNSKSDDYLSLFLQGKSPIMFTSLSLIKEIGYISELKSNQELVRIFKKILNDSAYCVHFVKQNNLKKFYPKKDTREILSEVMLLTLFNNSSPFTPEILRFEIRSNLLSTKSFFYIMTEIIDCADKKDTLCDLDEIFENYGLFVKLRG